MSASLVYASLDLVDADNNLNKDKKKKSCKSRGALDLIPLNHRLTNNKKGKKSIIQRSSKINVHEAKKQIQQYKDPTNDNVQRLLLLSSSKINPDVSDKIIERALKRRIIKKEVKKVEEEVKTVFTEEDFQNFEAEYVF
ncbi:hypothetical protein HCN44_002900 [Aphidius gifuensis]|uniref:40S ribosomal protein S19-binding protein 1 n=1 Tax=Aphidius gifuensis TaxID=684658 RepID=A0A835CRL7_APHGI|nr:active regulator of SIRT1-like [Aphidius gifuensis]KAF7991338.1 hypothetical protein HCN44_002900 [Aphidius gifuensis]